MMFLLLLLAAAPAEGFKARGFILPDGAVKIDDDRYRLPQPWDEAVKFYRRAYLRWIDATKRNPALRAERIDAVVALLERGVKARP